MDEQGKVFSGRSGSTKDIIKIIFLPTLPFRGGGCIGSLLWLFLLLLKIYGWILLPTFLVLGFGMHPGFFIGVVLLLAWILPVIPAIQAMNGKVIHSSLKKNEFKKRLTSRLKKEGAQALSVTSDDLMGFELSEIDRQRPPILAVEVVDTKKEGIQARLFLDDFDAGFDYDGDSIGALIFIAFARSFYVKGAGKVNRFIKQLSDEMGAAPDQGNPPNKQGAQGIAPQEPSNTPSAPEVLTAQGDAKIDAAQASSKASDKVSLMSDDDVEKILSRYLSRNGVKSVTDRWVQVMLMFPESSDSNVMLKVAEQEVLQSDINDYFPLVKNNDSFSMMNTTLSTEYFQVCSGGIVSTNFKTVEEAPGEVREWMLEEGMGVFMGFNFLELGQTAYENEEAFIGLGEAMLESLRRFEVVDVILGINEVCEGENILLFESSN